jgi:hypothetical protein
VLTFTRNAGIGDVDLKLWGVFRQMEEIYRGIQPTFFHALSVLIFCVTQYRSDEARRSMKGVPGVMALESHVFLFFSSSLMVLPIAVKNSLN